MTLHCFRASCSGYRGIRMHHVSLHQAVESIHNAVRATLVLQCIAGIAAAICTTAAFHIAKISSSLNENSFGAGQ